MSGRINIEIVAPGDNEYSVLDERLVAFNKTKTDWQTNSFVVVLRPDPIGIVGGVRGTLRMQTVEVRGLWLDENLRGKGLGERIMHALEAEALARGALSALLDTYEFQARAFYERIGYSCFAEFTYPNDVKRSYLTKPLRI